MLVRPSALITALLVVPLTVRAAPPACEAASGPHTVAVLELYTSEGCNSCPPADHLVSSLPSSGLTADKVLPLGFHVDYWDYIGWKDRFANPAYSQRQHDLARAGGASIVYTPQFFLDGRDFRGGENRLKSVIGEVNGTPARASIRLALRQQSPGQWDVVGRVHVPDGANAKDAVVYLALYENRLVSDVRAGENRGVTLKHDFVVRDWLGPLSVDPSGGLELKRTLQLKSDQKLKDSGVAAIVQNRRNSDVLQALQLPYCGT
jgi:hypothetical protein